MAVDDTETAWRGLTEAAQQQAAGIDVAAAMNNVICGSSNTGDNIESHGTPSDPIQDHGRQGVGECRGTQARGGYGTYARGEGVAARYNGGQHRAGAVVVTG